MPNKDMGTKDKDKRENAVGNLTKDPFVFNMPGAVEFAATEGQQEKTNIRLTLYDGSIVKHWFWGNLAFELATMRMAKKTNPILFGHDTDQRVAIGEKASFNGKFTLEGPFLKNSETARKIKTDMDDGFPFESSLRFDPARTTIVSVAEGQKVSVNGHMLTGPGTLMKNALVLEGSICVFGALKNTISEAFEILESERLSKGENIMPEKLTLEKFTAENPELLGQITESAKEEGRKEARANFTKFAEKFKDNPALVVEQFGKGATFEQALEAENAQLKENAKNPPKKPDPAEQEFSDLQTELTSEEKEKGKKGEPKTFAEAIELEMKADTSKKSEVSKRAAATRLCVTKYPKLHQMMLDDNIRTDRK